MEKLLKLVTSGESQPLRIPRGRNAMPVRRQLTPDLPPRSPSHTHSQQWQLRHTQLTQSRLALDKQVQEHLADTDGNTPDD